ncbi:MAG: hypothetical protein WC059_00755 [Candidatus Paceibacterota bacterium]
MTRFLIIDRDDFSRERIVTTLSPIFRQFECMFDGFKSFNDIVSTNGNKFNIAILSADVCIKARLNIQEFKKLFGAPECKIIITSAMVSELPSELSDADLFIKKDDLWDLRLKRKVELAEKILVLCPVAH